VSSSVIIVGGVAVLVLVCVLLLALLDPDSLPNGRRRFNTVLSRRAHEDPFTIP
jgi:hypothetical protein